MFVFLRNNINLYQVKTNTLLLAGLGVVAFVLLTSGKSAITTDYNLQSLSDQYGADNVQRLQDLLNVLGNQGLTSQQIYFLLSQALQETGLFTDVANLNAVDNYHNYAGISHGGTLSQYNSIDDFVSDWLNVLDKGAYPLQASSIGDFNNRLKSNGYYTDSATTYGNNLAYYYNLLTSLQ